MVFFARLLGFSFSLSVIHSFLSAGSCLRLLFPSFSVGGSPGQHSLCSAPVSSLPCSSLLLLRHTRTQFSARFSAAAPRVTTFRSSVLTTLWWRATLTPFKFQDTSTRYDTRCYSGLYAFKMGAEDMLFLWLRHSICWWKQIPLDLDHKTLTVHQQQPLHVTDYPSMI